mgnify:CR=1 FL=1|tara:strand:- start:2083 stop:2733 length:651 start_codon:yes stop_codon:yes gene_type:complete
MATVRMSDKLKSEIYTEADRQFENVNPKQKFSLALGDRIYNKYVEPLVQDVKKLKGKHNVGNYLAMEEAVEINIEIQDAFSEARVTDGYQDPIKMSASRKVPSKGGYNGTCTFIIKNDSPEGIEMLNIIKANEDIDINNRAYTRKVSDTLDNFTTLNQAIKAWPGLEKLVTNDWAVRRVNEKVTRKKRAQEQRQEIELNEAELNSVILTNSLIGGD